MPKKIFFLVLISLTLTTLAQVSPDKVFWQEDFSSGKLPDGWITVMENDSAVNWFVTDQPYPGSPGRNYQAPPIASASRGYHLQIAPGVKTGNNTRAWRNAEIWPDAYVQTPAIDCSKKKSVVLSFQQNFFWNRRDASLRAGLFVEVSNNGKEWISYDVRNEIRSGNDCPNPMDVELNITRTAAGQKSVYIRFHWKGLTRFYWMVDDIKLSEAYDADVMAYSLASHEETGNEFTGNDELVFKIVNLSAYDITKPFDCFLQIDKRKPLKAIVPASKSNPFKIIDTLNVSFPGIDLTDIGIHKISFYTGLPNDNRQDNDTISNVLYSGAYSLGEITDFKKGDNEFEISCHQAKIKIKFLRDDIFRIWMAYDGDFNNPAGNDLVINEFEDKINLKYTYKDQYHLFETPEMALRVYIDTLRFALYKADNETLVWEEAQGMTYGKETVQYLKRGGQEYFYGGGMQNGRFSHRGETIKLTIDYDWEDGGNPNPAPFYMSTNGYGALRNTYAPGEYSFGDTLKLIHNEARFDCYYFTGNGLKDALGDYTDLTGKPFMPPRWALGMGDANCYNRGATSEKTIGSTASGHSGTTPEVIRIIADEYLKHDMPRGWILPNDGYGCGYTKLDSVVNELHKRGFMTGLWTENGVEKIAYEVGTLGSRLCKLDVAWVGPGYKFGIDGIKAAYEGIENNSDARGFIWSVCGWAGTHRHSTVWTGDQSGTWDYIRWHIPTVIGSGLSAQNAATGDIDGIFGGSDSTYVRDLQWKCFTPIFMSMSGWATNNKNGIKDKQPWLFGEPFTSINRKYLKLKQRLTPYMYTLCNEAYQTGVPAVRGLVLEYPDDPVTWGTATEYEYLLGKDFLVAPVYKPEDRRDSIYFPEGTWIDYWDGTAYRGQSLINNYYAPLDKLPLFVRSGAIIPMYQQMNYDWERPTDTLTLDIYPKGISTYTIYEDDGLTREHREGIHAETSFMVKAPGDGKGPMNVFIQEANGDFRGRHKERVYILQVHTDFNPDKVIIKGKKIKQRKTSEAYDGQDAGWYYDPDLKKGMLFIKTNYLSTDSSSLVEIL